MDARETRGFVTFTDPYKVLNQRGKTLHSYFGRWS